MATVRAKCPSCGVVELTTADVTARVCLEDDRREYRFGCPVCAKVVVKTASIQTVDLLVASGVEMETWTIPAELYEHHTGPGINHDDVLDMHILLEDDALLKQYLDELIA